MILPRFHGDCLTLRLRDTHVRALRNVLGNVYLNSLTRYEQHEQLDSRGKVHCHKVQGVMEAFPDTPCKSEQFSSPKSRIHRLSRARQQINCQGLRYR